MNLNISVGEPFVISSVQDRPGFVHAFPYAWKTPAGRIFLSIAKERDIHDMERFLLKSEDSGLTWKDTDDWPTAGFPGSFPGAQVATGDGRMITCLCNSFASEEKGMLYIYDSFRDDPNGKDYWLRAHGCGQILGRFITVIN